MANRDSGDDGRVVVDNGGDDQRLRQSMRCDDGWVIAVSGKVVIDDGEGGGVHPYC